MLFNYHALGPETMQATLYTTVLILKTLWFLYNYIFADQKFESERE